MASSFIPGCPVQLQPDQLEQLDGRSDRRLLRLQHRDLRPQRRQAGRYPYRRSHVDRLLDDGQIRDWTSLRGVPGQKCRSGDRWGCQAPSMSPNSWTKIDAAANEDIPFSEQVQKVGHP